MKKVPITGLLALVQHLTKKTPDLVFSVDGLMFEGKDISQSDSRSLIYPAAERVYENLLRQNKIFAIGGKRLYRLAHIYGNALFEFKQFGLSASTNQDVETLELHEVAAAFSDIYITSGLDTFPEIANHNPFNLNDGLQRKVMCPFVTPEQFVSQAGIKFGTSADVAIIRVRMSLDGELAAMDRTYGILIPELMDLLTGNLEMQEVFFENDCVKLVETFNQLVFADHPLIKVTGAEHIRIGLRVNTEEVDYGNGETPASV